MKKRKTGICALTTGAIAGLCLLAFTYPVLGSGPDDLLRQPKVDDRQDPLTKTQRDLRKKALQASLNGKAYGKTHEVARGQYVDLKTFGNSTRKQSRERYSPARFRPLALSVTKSISPSPILSPMSAHQHPRVPQNWWCRTRPSGADG